ncbi:hypothetical protein T484DRAFT_1746164 [Baffinella frigidus]|nr:hypothetical protein T484DRAFT_1746164 [Cryptophyta sp. CCMP2293]
MVANNQGSPRSWASPADEGGDAGMVRSASDLKPGHMKMKHQKSMFKRCSSPPSPRTRTMRATSAPANLSAASSLTAFKTDMLAERLGTLMIRRAHIARSESCKGLLENGKAEVTGMEKRFALEKRRPSPRLRRSKRPPALSWDQVEHCLDLGGGAHSALIEGGAWEASDVDASSPEAEHKMPSDMPSDVPSHIQWCV